MTESWLHFPAPGYHISGAQPGTLLTHVGLCRKQSPPSRTSRSRVSMAEKSNRVLPLGAWGNLGRGVCVFCLRHHVEGGGATNSTLSALPVVVRLSPRKPALSRYVALRRNCPGFGGFSLSPVWSCTSMIEGVFEPSCQYVPGIESTRRRLMSPRLCGEAKYHHHLTRAQ